MRLHFIYIYMVYTLSQIPTVRTLLDKITINQNDQVLVSHDRGRGIFR